ncbi:DUF1830 domain-containing protein [Synechococcus sp. RSCCF101]|uniref:DUF1830 domain-containing protein n=1 Tax=Synechococcus sp. RSCCF101 TaxID=2511069 RepID=UPI001245E22E|nr:DUF1830 domain-containing protein [Synechococcus sp. RSCCF101]QEY31674.1 DUF1830 domain-containing protein [Synechococcus sp. RSCCF101]
MVGCSYRNTSDRILIIKCCGDQHFFLERVVFPFELLSFQAPKQALVEVWTHGLGGPELIARHGAEELSSEEGVDAVSGAGSQAPE